MLYLKQGKFGTLGAMFLFIFLPCMWGLGLRKTRPATRVFGPFGPEVPPEVPERVSPKSGVCLEVSEGVLQGSAQNVSKK